MTPDCYGYLEGQKSWTQVTREERFFCAELFLRTRENVDRLVNLASKALQQKQGHMLQLDKHGPWEIGYEVCFYRDLFAPWGIGVVNQIMQERIRDPFRQEGETSRQFFPHKRTFDLCLFSPTTIVIVEAKAQQHFDMNQLEQLRWDKEIGVHAALRLSHLLQGRDELELCLPDIHVVGLAAAKYLKDQRVLTYLDGVMNWDSVCGEYSDDEADVLRRADGLASLTCQSSADVRKTLEQRLMSDHFLLQLRWRPNVKQKARGKAAQ